MDTKTAAFPLSKMILYSMGQFGWSLLNCILIGLVTFFYMPPETGKAVITPLISQKAVFGVFTIVGICSFVGLVVPVFTDPLFGSLSDKSKSVFGRRRKFMLLGAIPLASVTFLIFVPPIAHVSMINAVWVFAAIILFNVCMSAFKIPYIALVPELGSTSKARMLISTLTSISWILGYAVGMSIFAVKDIFAGIGMSPIASFRLCVFIFAVLALIGMLLPVCVVDEKRYCIKEQAQDAEGALKLLASAFKNSEFVVYTIGITLYYFADAFLQIGLVYFVTVLMKLPDSMTFNYFIAMMLLAFVWYPVVNIVAGKIGKKKLLIFGLIAQCLSFVLLSLCGLLSFVPAMAWGIGVIVLQSIVAAITGIVPMALLSDIIRADTIKTGVPKAGTYNGATSIIMKLPLALPALIFPSLLLLGRSIDKPTGVRLAAVIAACVMVLSIIVLFFYNEKKVFADLAQEEPELGQ